MSAVVLHVKVLPLQTIFPHMCVSFDYKWLLFGRNNVDFLPLFPTPILNRRKTVCMSFWGFILNISKKLGSWMELMLMSRFRKRVTNRIFANKLTAPSSKTRSLNCVPNRFRWVICDKKPISEEKNTVSSVEIGQCCNVFWRVRHFTYLICVFDRKFEKFSNSKSNIHNIKAALKACGRLHNAIGPFRIVAGVCSESYKTVSVHTF